MLFLTNPLTSRNVVCACDEHAVMRWSLWGVSGHRLNMDCGVLTLFFNLCSCRKLVLKPECGVCWRQQAVMHNSFLGRVRIPPVMFHTVLTLLSALSELGIWCILVTN